MKLRPGGQLGTRTIRRFRSDMEGSVTTHPPRDFALDPGFDRQRDKDERPQMGALYLGEWCLRR